MGSVPRGASILTVARALAGMGRGLLLQGGDAPTYFKLWLLGRPAPDLDPVTLVAFSFASILGFLLFAVSLAIAWRERRGDSFWPALAIGSLCGLVAAVNWLGSDPQFWLPVYPFLYWAGARTLDALAGQTRHRLGQVGLAGLVVLFFAANLAWPVPTAWHPRGGAEWRSARRFGQTLKSGDLLLGLGSLWSFWVVESAPQVNRVSLLMDVTGRGQPYLEAITTKIDSTLAAGRAAYGEGLDPQPSLALEGEWENIESIHSVGRDSVLAVLRNRYRLDPLPGIGAGLRRLARPEPEEVPSRENQEAILPQPHHAAP
jgi:hypothetical protein